MKATISILSLSLTVAACSSLDSLEQLSEQQSSVELTQSKPATTHAGAFVTTLPYDGAAYQATRQSQLKQQIYQPQSGVNVNHYVQGMMQDLIANLSEIRQDMIVGITSFVYLDGSYDQADLFGNQLSESFMHEVHQFGLNVVDFKTTDYIRVTAKGDFVFSRDFMELREEQPIEFVLGGTLVQHQGGTLVNVRLISVATKKVLGTAQGFIPQQVVDALEQSAQPGKLLLKQGD